MTEELFRQDAYLRTCKAEVISVDETGIILDRTVFYPEGGGQPGDTGVLRTDDGRGIVIVDTRKDKASGRPLHIPGPDQPTLAPGEIVTCEIDWDRRYRHMRMHTTMHLVCGIVDGAVTGGQVGAEKGRLDFNLPEGLDKEAVQAKLDELIAADHPVEARWISDTELEQRPELVRTMSVKPPSGAGQVRLLAIGDGAVDLQPCGGTHVARTGEIGAVRVGKVENKGRQNRRINLHLEA